MSAATAATAPTPQNAPSIPVRARDLLGCEWTKFRSVRSTYWTLAVAVVTPIGSASSWPPPSPPRRPAGRRPIRCCRPAQPGVRGDRGHRPGVLSFSSEFGTGLIRPPSPRRRGAARCSPPRRRDGTVTLITGEVVAFSSFFADQAILAGHHLSVGISDPGVPGAVLATGVLLCVCALIGVAIGAIVRHTRAGSPRPSGDRPAGHPGPAPGPWNDRIGRFTLLDAARQVTALHRSRPVQPGRLPAGPAGLAAAALAAAALLITAATCDTTAATTRRVLPALKLHHFSISVRDLDESIQCTKPFSA